MGVVKLFAMVALRRHPHAARGFGFGGAARGGSYGRDDRPRRGMANAPRGQSETVRESIDATRHPVLA